MKLLHHLIQAPQIALLAIVGFVVPTALLWVLKDSIGVVLFYQGDAMVDPALVARAQYIILGLLTFIFALLQIVLVSLYILERRTKSPFTKEVVTDLMVSREQFRLLYDSSPAPYFLVDDEGNIRSPNIAAVRFFGSTRDALLLTNFFKLFNTALMNPDRVSVMQSKIKNSISVDKTEVHLITPAGEHKKVLASVYPLDSTSPVPFKHLVTLVEAPDDSSHEQNLHA